MKRISGITRRCNDEWYTPRATAVKLAAYLASKSGMRLDDPILCPADVLPDGSESELPWSLRDAGFRNVRATRDLPMDVLFADWREGETVVTNPPFSLLTPFRRWLMETGARYCVLSRPGCIGGWTVPEMEGHFFGTDGRGVAACWMQNLVDTRAVPPENRAISDCADCKRKRCPDNVMTRDWTSGRQRRLYGWSIAVKFGIAGRWCQNYTREDGSRMFTRFFHS